jgi:hypothetical protein
MTSPGTDQVYSTREVGVKFTSPANATLKVAGLAMGIHGAVGTPTGQMRLNLYNGTTLLGRTNPLSAITQGNDGWVRSYFSSPIQLPPSTVARVTLGETANADTSANTWSLNDLRTLARTPGA